MKKVVRLGERRFWLQFNMNITTSEWWNKTIHKPYTGSRHLMQDEKQCITYEATYWKCANMFYDLRKITVE